MIKSSLVGGGGVVMVLWWWWCGGVFVVVWCWCWRGSCCPGSPYLLLGNPRLPYMPKKSNHPWLVVVL